MNVVPDFFDRLGLFVRKNFLDTKFCSDILKENLKKEINRYAKRTHCPCPRTGRVPRI